MAEGCRRAGSSAWGRRLMPSHVHLISTPRDDHGLHAALNEADRRYTRPANFPKS